MRKATALWAVLSGGAARGEGGAGGSASAPRENRRMILSYPWDGCAAKPAAASNKRQLRLVGRLELDRVSILQELSRMASKLIASKQRAGQRGGENLIWGFSSEEQSPSAGLKTRYLAGLKMEVITEFSPMLERDELQDLALTLPCVDGAFMDEEKKISHAPDEYTLELVDENRARLPQWLLPLVRGGETLRGGAGRDAKGPEDWKSKFSRAETPWNLDEKHPHSVLHGRGHFSGSDKAEKFTVAIIDSGCDMSHSRLVNKRWKNPGEICDDGIDNDRNGLVDDCYGWDFALNRNDPRPGVDGHGTGAAGIVAGEGYGGSGKISVCPNCDIMCLKFINGKNGTVSDQIQAIDYAVVMGARVSNNSYGGYTHSEAEFEAVRRAEAAGHLFVASAGNQAANTDLAANYHTPSGYRLANVVSVGASDRHGQAASFSNYGPSSVHVFAPGAEILVLGPRDNFLMAMGTSFAAPHVAGLAAVVWAAYPRLSAAEVKRAIVDGCSVNGKMSHLAACQGCANLSASLRVAEKMATRKALRKRAKRAPARTRTKDAARPEPATHPPQGGSRPPRSDAASVR